MSQNQAGKQQASGSNNNYSAFASYGNAYGNAYGNHAYLEQYQKAALARPSNVRGLSLDQYARAEQIFNKYAVNGKIDFNALNNVDQKFVAKGIAEDSTLKFKSALPSGAQLDYNEFLAVYKVLFT